MTTRSEHLEWCKQRAREYFDRGDVQNGLASMLSDLDKHPETQGHPAGQMAIILMLTGHLETNKQIRDFVEGIR